VVDKSGRGRSDAALAVNAVRSADLSDRLVYQFAGLESLLVFGEQAQLLQNIRERSVHR